MNKRTAWRACLLLVAISAALLLWPTGSARFNHAPVTTIDLTRNAIGNEKTKVSVRKQERTPLVNPRIEIPFERSVETRARVVPDYADAGGASIFIPGGSQIRMTPATGLRRDWSAHDHVRLEVVNPSDKKEHIYIQIRDSENAHGYWSWHNRFEQLAPGKNILQIPTAEVWRGENLRRNPQGNLNTKDVQALCISAVKQDLFITDMQLAAKSDSTNHLDGKAEE